MKTLAAYFLFLAGVVAAPVTLEWNPNPEADVVAYKLWKKNQGGEWVVVKQVDTTTVTLDQAPGTWETYAVTALNSGGLESGWSVPLEFQLSPDGSPIFRTPTVPTGFRVRVTVDIEPTP